MEKNVSVVGWVRRPPESPVAGVRYRTVDIRSADQCGDAMALDGPDRVFHLAAKTHLADCDGDPAGAHETNVKGTRNVFHAMGKDALGILASTCHVYGPPEVLPIGEGHRTNPLGVYAQTKLDAEGVVLETSRSVVIARAFHHTGPGQSNRYALADWCQQLQSGAEVLRVGNIDVRRDYTDVRDVVEGYQVLIERGTPGEVYNLCSGRAVPMSVFIGWAANGRPVQVRTDPARLRDTEVSEFCGDPAKAEGLGWRRTRALKDTMIQMAQLSCFNRRGHP